MYPLGSRSVLEMRYYRSTDRPIPNPLDAARTSGAERHSIQAKDVIRRSKGLSELTTSTSSLFRVYSNHYHYKRICTGRAYLYFYPYS